MKLQEATQKERILLYLWENYLGTLTETDAKGEMADRLKELLQAHYTDRGLKPPAKESRLSFMFYGFVGGA